jgi:Family of unknown function (DUF6148)
MAGITLAQAQSQLDAWLAASLAVASSQSYSIAGRSLTRADARTINDMVTKWQNEVNRLTRANSGRSRTRYVVPA